MASPLHDKRQLSSLMKEEKNTALSCACQDAAESVEVVDGSSADVSRSLMHPSSDETEMRAPLLLKDTE